MFNFFLKSYRKDILTFPGTIIPKIVFDINSPDSMLCFKKYDNGEYNNLIKNDIPIPTRHPNILKCIITSKKSFGLHVKMWSEGISEGTFSLNEILLEFSNNDIELPESFKKDLENTIFKMKYK